MSNRPTEPARKLTSARIVVVTVGISVFLAVALGVGARGFDPAVAISWLRGFQSAWWAPLAFFCAYAVLNIAFVPTQALSIAAAVIWGWKAGGAIELVSATLGALPPYFIARGAAHRWTNEQTDARWLEKLRREGFSALLILRMVPVIPYTALNYVAGAAGIRLRDYFLGTLFGVLPSTFIFAYFVDAIVAGILTPLDATIRVIVAGIVMATLVVATRIAARRLTA